MNRPIFHLRTVLYLLTIASLFSMVACSSTGKVDISKLPDPPSTQELATLHNERVSQLESLWARVSVRAKGTYDDGESYEEQGEGHLQIVQPDKVSLQIGKLGEMYFIFGANDERYWSFNLADGDNKVMLSGSMDGVTPAKASALGLPVHPTELIQLSGLSAIDMSRAGGTRWREDGKAVGIRVPARWGSAVLWFDEADGLVVRTQAFNSDGELVATADLSRYKPMVLNGLNGPMVPGKIEISTPNDDGFVRIELSDADQRDIRPMVFQPERLRRAYRADQVIDLDEEFREMSSDIAP